MKNKLTVGVTYNTTHELKNIFAGKREDVLTQISIEKEIRYSRRNAISDTEIMSLRTKYRNGKKLYLVFKRTTENVAMYGDQEYVCSDELVVICTSVKGMKNKMQKLQGKYDSTFDIKTRYYKVSVEI